MKKQSKLEKVVDAPKTLPGFLKKSFSLDYHGGVIWIEHLDGMYGYEELVLEKFNRDLKILLKPSTSSYICINLDETKITDQIVNRIIEVFQMTDKHFSKVCFVGVDHKHAKIFQKKLTEKGIMVAFIHDFEKAKEWLL